MLGGVHLNPFKETVIFYILSWVLAQALKKCVTISVFCIQTLSFRLSCNHMKMIWCRGDEHIQQLHASWTDAHHSVPTTKVYLMFLGSDEKLWKTQKHYLHIKHYSKVHHKPKEFKISMPIHGALLHGHNIKTNFKS